MALLLLVTFVSPAFAWHMHDEHDALGMHTGHSPDPGHEDHEHDTSHAAFGHLLEHLPMFTQHLALVMPVGVRSAPPAEVPALPLARALEPPDRPPLLLDRA